MEILGFSQTNFKQSRAYFKQEKGKYVLSKQQGDVTLDSKAMREYNKMSKDKENTFTMDMLPYIPFFKKEDISESEYLFSSGLLEHLESSIHLIHLDNLQNKENYHVGQSLKVDTLDFKKQNLWNHENVLTLSEYLNDLFPLCETLELCFVKHYMKPIVSKIEVVGDMIQVHVLVDLRKILTAYEKASLFNKEMSKYDGIYSNIYSYHLNNNNSLPILYKNQEFVCESDGLKLIPLKLKTLSFKLGFEVGCKYKVVSEEIPNYREGTIYLLEKM